MRWVRPVNGPWPIYGHAKDGDVKQNKTEHFFFYVNESGWGRVGNENFITTPTLFKQTETCSPVALGQWRNHVKMSVHANEAGNKENVNVSPAFHVKKKKKRPTIYLHFQTKMKKLPRHKNTETISWQRVSREGVGGGGGGSIWKCSSSPRLRQWQEGERRAPEK